MVSELDRLGGLLPLGGERLTAVRHGEVQRMSAEHQVEFADGHVDLLLRYGCCSFAREIFVRFDSPEAAHVHDPDLGIPNCTREGCGLSHFYGTGAPVDTLDIEWAITTYRTRMPHGSLPVAADGSGGQICFVADPSRRRGFYWWDHENEWDEEDYLVDVGQEMPEAVKYQNLYFIADDLEGLLKRAEVLPDV